MSIALLSSSELTVFVCVVAEAFGLSHPDSYHYLRHSSCVADKTINDHGTFQDVLVRRTQLALSLKRWPAHSSVHPSKATDTFIQGSPSESIGGRSFNFFFVCLWLTEFHANDAVHGGEHRGDPAPPGRDPPRGEHRVHDGRRSAGLLQIRWERVSPHFTSYVLVQMPKMTNV